MTEKISRAPGPYGRGTSFGRDTSGYRGQMPVLFSNGKGRRPSEGYKNVLTNEESRPPGGWNDPPPCPTGDTIPLHSTDAYRDGWDRIWGKKEQTA
jgi:hypothetical protein